MGSSEWRVGFTSKAARQKKKIPQAVAEELARLIGDLEQDGPIQKGWAHFSSLKKEKGVPSSAYHCHLKSGRPTYVVCWQVLNKTIQIIEPY